MDSVPNPSILNVVSSPHPHISIYDQEKPERWGVCYGNTVQPSIACSDSSISDEAYMLDDKLEDSTLQNLLTSEVISSLRTSSSSMSPEFQWGVKSYGSVPAEQTDSNLTATPTLSELNMETDFSIVSDLLNLEGNVNQSLDFLPSNSMRSNPKTSLKTISSSKNPICPRTVQAQNKPECGQHSDILQSNKKLMDLSGSSFIKKFTQIVDNFPPRGSQPPVVGVVAPVKKEPDSVPFTKLSDNDSSQSPCLQSLLKQTSPVVKSEYRAVPCEVNDLKKELPAQIVPPSHGQAPPSHNGNKRNFNGTFKSEPVSPQSAAIVVNDESLEERWKDIENFIHEADDDPMLNKRRRYDSGGSENTSDDNDDYLYFGENDGDDSEDGYSDIDDDITHYKPTECESLVATGKKQKQFFWQYNVQSKGPKGTRLKLAIESPSDPHILNDFEDPVFDECNTSVAGIRHGGKARKGDGNEITPNPKKLFMIGHQLLRLNRQINACQLGPDVPSVKRNESRKEKNKLASRACRLKKKAQHEANKIKLYGLEQEHGQLNEVIKYVYPLLKEKAKLCLSQMEKSPSSCDKSTESLHKKLENYHKETISCDIAGKTADFVNSVILSVESGQMSGGLDIRRKYKS